jgi:hypothetical protein
MVPVEPTPGIGGGGYRRMLEGVNSSMIYLMHCKNLCKCHNVPPLHNKKKKKKIYRKNK